MSAKKLEKLLHAGNHQEVLRNTLDSKLYTYRTEDLLAIIGSLTFLGRLPEAEGLYLEHHKKLGAESLAAIQFYLGVGFTRHSEYKKGKQYFAKNLKLSRKNPTPLIRYYTYQGMGFWRYLRNRFRFSVVSAKKALLEAQKAHFLYGKYLAQDLMGHALLQTGHISLGLQTLEQAKLSAEKLGTGGMSQAAHIALLCYRAQFGLIPKTAIQELRRTIEKTPTENTYSLASLHLELARQLTLRGQVSKSLETLNEACRIIYASRHRRQGALLNLRYAYNHFLKGEHHLALNLLRNSFSEIDPEIDLGIQLQAKGLEYLVMHALGQAWDKIDMDRLTRITGQGIAERIWNRGKSPFSVRAPGEDPLGDTLDLLATAREEAIPMVLKQGYWGLLKQVVEIPMGEVLYLDIIPDTVLISNRGDILFKESGLTPQTRALLLEVASGPKTKEHLVKKVWNYEYHPLRHDRILYTAVSRLRAILEPYGHWITVTENSYGLSPGVKVLSHELPTVTRSTIPAHATGSPFNARQLELMRSLGATGFWDVQKYRKKFRVSQITASRDLSFLVEQGKLIRVGRARATQYCAPGSDTVV